MMPVCVCVYAHLARVVRLCVCLCVCVYVRGIRTRAYLKRFSVLSASVCSMLHNMLNAVKDLLKRAHICARVCARQRRAVRK